MPSIEDEPRPHQTLVDAFKRVPRTDEGRAAKIILLEGIGTVGMDFDKAEQAFTKDDALTNSGLRTGIEYITRVIGTEE